MDFLGGLISAGASLFGSNSAAKRQEKLSKEFAQHGIQWRVEDAKAAGIHPLAALGASTHTAPGLPVGGDAVAAGLGKAADALLSERGALENDLLRAQIEKTNSETSTERATSRTIIANARRRGQTASTAPPPPEHTGRFIPGEPGPRVLTSDPRWSDAQKFEDRYGELSDFIFGPMILNDDATYRASGMPRGANWDLLMHRLSRGRDSGRAYRHR